MHGLFIDNFCGGGGASTGIAAAIGRDVDVAINHDPVAIAVHRANHPTTTHHCQDIRAVWPASVTKLKDVAGAWFSPDCKEHSKAKGGPVKDRNIRALPEEVITWLRQVRPIVGYVENVEEMQWWGPLDERGHIIKELRGKYWKRWIRNIRREGYTVQYRELRACDYGAPTSRKRLYVIMRRDGQPIVWPKPTHGKPTDSRVVRGKLLPYRTAADCIDWSIDCPSIFMDREEIRARGLRIKRPLEDATLRRVAHGVMRYVLNNPRPFIVPITHTHNSPTAHDSLEVEAAYIDRQFTKSVGAAVDAPAPATTAGGGGKTAQVSAFLSRFHRSNTNGGKGNPTRPLGAVTAGGTHHSVVCAHLEQANGGFAAEQPGHDARKPMSTVTVSGSQQRLVETTLLPEDALSPEMMARANMVAAFLVKYYGAGESQVQAVDQPFHTVTTLPRFAAVTVTIDAATYVVVDIGLRMFTPRELARAQGFPESYVLDPVIPKIIRGKLVHQPLTKAEQIRMIGNSVCPDVARALVSANQPGVPTGWTGTVSDWRLAA